MFVGANVGLTPVERREPHGLRPAERGMLG